MYEKYPWRGTTLTYAHTRTHTRTHTHTHIYDAGSVGINGLQSRRDCQGTLKSIVLMGFLSGTPVLICIQPYAAHPRNSFLGKGIMTPQRVVMARSIDISQKL